MKRNTLIKGLILPLALGLISGVAFFFYTDSSLVNYAQEAVGEIAYFDCDESSAQNEIVGEISFADKKLDVRKNCDYSYMINSASFTHGSLPGQPGIGYFQVLEKDINGVKSSPVKLSYGKEEHSYRFISSFDCKNESDVFLHFVSVNNGIVLYCRASADYGLKDGYTALVFEEAE